MPREEKLAIRIADLESVASVMNCFVRPCCRSGCKGELGGRHILATCPSKHFRVKRISIGNFPKLPEGHGEECHGPRESAGHPQSHFSGSDRFFQLSAHMQYKLEGHVRQK